MEETKPTLQITEWKYSQTLGKQIPVEDFLKDKNLDLLRLTNLKVSEDGRFYIQSDMGGKIAIFEKNVDKEGKPRLDHYYDYQAQEREFDVHKSCELSKAVRGLDIVTCNEEKVDLLSSNYRTIKYDRVINKGRTFIWEEPVKENFECEKMLNCNIQEKLENLSLFENGNDKNNEIAENTNFTYIVPKVKEIKFEKKHRTKKKFSLAHTNEINSLVSHKFNKNNFISSDENKILFWDINENQEVYNLVNIEDINNDEENPEKITVTKFCNHNPHLLSFGTNFGNIFLTDLRISSNISTNSTKFFDETSPFIKTIFNQQLAKVHDLEFLPMNSSENTIISRHYLSLNTWDKRNTKAPVLRIMLYEPLISKLSHLYGNNYMNDRFTLSVDGQGKHVFTGNYNNIFHVIDLNQKLNTQITIDEGNEKTMNMNVIRKINAKGMCGYKKDDPSLTNLNFDKKILHQRISPLDGENFVAFGAINCIYTYSGKLNQKK